MLKESLKDSVDNGTSEQILTCPFCLRDNLIIVDGDNEILYMDACKHFKHKVGDIIGEKKD